MSNIAEVPKVPPTVPGKIPVKIPVKVMVKLPGSQPLHVPAPAPVVARQVPSFKSAPARPTKRQRELSSDSDSDSDSDSSSSASSSGSSSGSYSSSSSSFSRESTVEPPEPAEPTLLDLALKEGIVKEDAMYDEEEEEVVQVPPPRPPRFNTFPVNIEAALERQRDKLNREESAIRIKDDNKAVSLGTSKVNYIDPRIICSWAKAHDVPIKRIFSATLQKKFPWAMSAENFEF